MINRLTLKSFAAFEDLFIDFSPRINVIIGENSCGKTQVTAWPITRIAAA